MPITIFSSRPIQSAIEHLFIIDGGRSRPRHFLGNDAEVRTNDDRSFTTMSLATKSSYKKDGKYISHTEWHRCIVFGKLAEFAGTLQKGAHLQVEGELRSREYEAKKVGKKAAQKKAIWEIRVNSILKLDRAAKSSSDDSEHEDAPQEEVAE
jgi:single-strand DNA-binding protein